MKIVPSSLLTLTSLASFTVSIWNKSNVVVLAAEENGQQQQKNTKKKKKSSDEFECGMYYAPSSIKEAGWGVFAGRDYDRNSDIGGTSISIIFATLNRYNNWTNPKILHYDYFWMPDSIYQWYESLYGEMLVPGLGALTNYHPWLFNIRPRITTFNDSIMDRTTDEGSGAISYYDHTFFATEEIRAGDELFANYGEQWVYKRQSQGKINLFPLASHYETSEAILEDMFRIIRKVPDGSKDEVVARLKAIIEKIDETTALLMPESTDDLDILLEEGPAALTLEPRGMNYLKYYGYCMDQIKLNESTIPGAGRGIFAQKHFSAGEFIAPLPLIHVSDKNVFNTYKYYDDSHGNMIVTDEKVTDQLITNYCFGDSRSSVLLCGSTIAMMANHQASDDLSIECLNASVEGTCEENEVSEGFKNDGPNAYFRWAEWDKTNDEWLSLSNDELKNKSGRGLSLELIALREIGEGEEIFVDYGKSWSSAWKEHVQKWKPPVGSFEYVTELERAGIFKTLIELREDPYPDNILQVCLYWEQDRYSDFPAEDPSIHNWQNMNEDIFISTFSVPGHEYRRGELSPFEESYWPCDIYERSEDKKRYTVRIRQSVFEDEASWSQRGLPRLLTNYPARSIRFVHNLESSDQFLPGAFRHPIGLGDDLFPNQWFDLED